ncbi:MAG: hypothetical protein AAF557_17390 [Pseudomonadota bacterium]
MTRKFDFRPAPPDRTLTTLDQVKTWMHQSGCNFIGYQIGHASIDEGYILRQERGEFTWSYSERGKITRLETFDDEASAVAFAVQRICEDAWACSHSIGIAKNPRVLTEIISTLDARRIAYFQDEIPYGGPNDPRYRVFVHGKHAAQVADLREKYRSFD